MRSKIYSANHFCYILCMCKISIFSDRKNQLDSSEKIPCHCFFTGWYSSVYVQPVYCTLFIYFAILFDTFADVFFRALFLHKFRWRKTRVFFFFYLLFSFLKRHSLALLFAVVGVPGHGAFLYSKAEDGGRKLQVLTNGSKSVGRESLFHLGANFFVVSGDIENLEQALIVYRPAQQAWKNPSKQHTQNIT